MSSRPSPEQTRRYEQYGRRMDALRGYDRPSDEACQRYMFRIATGNGLTCEAPEVLDEVHQIITAAPGFTLMTAFRAPRVLTMEEDVFEDPITAWAVGRRWCWPITISQSAEDLAQNLDDWAIRRPDGAVETFTTFHRDVEAWLREINAPYLDAPSELGENGQKARDVEDPFR